MSKERNPYIVYFIGLPGTKVGYVGVNQYPRAKLQASIALAMRGLRPGWLLADWIRSLSDDERASLEVVELHVVGEKEDPGKCEDMWIDSLFSEVRLLNTYAGGGGIHSRQSRMELSERALGKDPSVVAQRVKELRSLGCTYLEITEELDIGHGTAQRMATGHHVAA